MCSQRRPASDFAKFVASEVAKRGEAVAQYDGNDKERQKAELEKSVRFLREEIGLGTKSVNGAREQGRKGARSNT
jgi:hypothetical protein